MMKKKEMKDKRKKNELIGLFSAAYKPFLEYLQHTHFSINEIEYCINSFSFKDNHSTI